MTDYTRFLSRAGRDMQQSAIRQMGTLLAQSPDMISFAPGYPAEDRFPREALAGIARDLLTGTDGSVLQYGPTRGHRDLCETAIEIMRGRGIDSAADRIVVTTGSQQGLDLVARVLLDPGDVALLELPSYTGAIAAFRNVGATLVGVRQESDGIDVEALDETCARLRSEGRRIKLLYVVPNFQNPTGLLMSRTKREWLLDWARRRGVLLIEDDPYADLYFEDVTNPADTRPMAADDRDGVGVYLSSFSKTLAPGFRIGWMHAPAALASRVELAKQAEDLCSGTFDQRIVTAAWSRGVIQNALPGLRVYYRQKRDAIVSALGRHLGDQLTWTVPRGGFFLWAALTGGLQARTVLPEAQARGVIFVDGSAFFVDGTGQTCLRLSFSAPALTAIEEGVRRLAQAVQAAARAADAR